MPDQDPKALFKQSLQELKEAIIELKQAWKELNEKLDELHQEVLERWWQPMPNNIAQLASQAHNLVYILTYISCGLLVLAFALLLFQKFDKRKARPIVEYTVKPIKALVLIIIVFLFGHDSIDDC